MGRFGGWYFSCIGVLVVVLAAAGRADADAIVTGNVFCDQCRDGHLTLFDVPVDGAKVAIECQGQAAITGTSNFIGNYMIKFGDTPDLSGCSARVIESPPNSGCDLVGSPAKPLNLDWRLFSMEVYSVESLFFYPAKPMSFCGNTPKLPPPIISLPPPPPVAILPPPPPPPPVAIIPPSPLPPVAIISPTPPPPPSGGIISLPPLPHLPPIPFLEPSACSYDYWVKKEYLCHWRFVRPETKVSIVFGEEAGKRYGHSLTLWQGLQGRGDVYRALLREATASLLNSYNTLGFRYNSVSVLMHMHWTLHAASPHYALIQAMSFKKANLGIGGGFGGKGNAKCLLTLCK